MRLRAARKVLKARRGGEGLRGRALRRLFHWARRAGPPDRYHAVDLGGGLRPANLWQWAYWFEDVQNRIVACTERGRRGVSTICLGLDHGGVWYESALFTVADDGKRRFDPIERYTTRAEAVAGHAVLVAHLPEPG